jgi:hypothetical protein
MNLNGGRKSNRTMPFTHEVKGTELIMLGSTESRQAFAQTFSA